MLHVEQLEDKLTPATLDVVSGLLTFTGDVGTANVVTQSVSGTSLIIYDASGAISLTQDAINAGCAVSGGVATVPRSAVASEVFDLGGDAGDKFNLRQNDVPLTVRGTGTVYISSNAPTNTGDLDGILGAVQVDPLPSGGTNLWVSDAGSTSGNAAVVIDTSGIYGLAPADITYGSGAFNLVRVSGSNSAFLSESFTIAGTPGTLQLYAGAGDDNATVVADTAGFIRMGSGNDTVTVDSAVTFTGAVYGDAGADVFNINGVVTGGVIQ